MIISNASVPARRRRRLPTPYAEMLRAMRGCNANLKRDFEDANHTAKKHNHAARQQMALQPGE